ncbi:MAG: GT-D fold domain-containing protein [Lachnospiraceae bacterium]|nr:GT-D fold domain-containing protein [Lachnospiraceae bacterium]
MTEQEIQILEAMLERIEKCESANNLLMDSNKALIRSNHILTDALNALRSEYESYTDNAVYEIRDPRNLSIDPFYPKIKTIDETLNTLLSSDKSLCRFGDGEFASISGNLRAKFTTRYFPKLADRLRSVLNSNDENIMIAIADNYGNLSHYSPQSRREIRNYMTKEIRALHASLLNPDMTYYNAYVTRPHMHYYNNEEKNINFWSKIRSLWQDRDLVIIEGQNTGMGVGNDLFDNCRKTERIIAPSVDAFAKYDELFDYASGRDSESLYLIALGPVATVLAYDLAKTGRRAIDIGHLDIEYEWMKRGSYRTLIPNKYVNEVDGGNTPEPIENEKYLSQIIQRI